MKKLIQIAAFFMFGSLLFSIGGCGPDALFPAKMLAELEAKSDDEIAALLLLASETCQPCLEGFDPEQIYGVRNVDSRVSIENAALKNLLTRKGIELKIRQCPNLAADVLAVHQGNEYCLKLTESKDYDVSFKNLERDNLSGFSHQNKLGVYELAALPQIYFVQSTEVFEGGCFLYTYNQSTTVTVLTTYDIQQGSNPVAQSLVARMR